MLVFAAITPHPPILLPTIGKDNIRFLEKTSAAYRELGENLYAAQPDTIIIISPHGTMLQNAFSVNVMPSFHITFQEFGDLLTKFDIAGDVGLSHHIKEKIETKIPIVLTSQVELDHGVGIPLYFLTENLDRQKTKLIPISFSLLDLDTHFEFGRSLQEEILNNTKRIAVVASGDLSHRLSQHSPAGFSSRAKEFDNQLTALLTGGQASEVLHMDRGLIEDAAECGLRSIVILLGILNSVRTVPQVLSYEAPFGVGYLTVNYRIDY